jgi:hypothetical protein
MTSDAVVLQPFDAVQGEPVHGDHVDLERAGLTFLIAKLLEPLDQPVELLLVAAAVHPPVGAGRAAQCGIGMSTDQNRNRLGRSRSHLGFGNVVELAVELEVFAGGQSLNDFDALVHPLAPPGERYTHDFVILRPRAATDSEREPVADHRRQRAGLFGHQRRWADRQLEYKRREAQGAGDRAQRRGQHKGFDKRFAVQEFTIAVRGIGVFRVGLEGVGDAVGNRHAGVAGCLGRLGQRDVERRVGHGFGVGEPHIVSS